MNRLWLIYAPITKQTNKLRGLFSPQANYNGTAAAICRRSQCQRLQVEGCRVVRATGLQDR
jgi:hypothetical protein